MSIKNAALLLNELNKIKDKLPDGRLRHELEGHIQDICKALLQQCVLRNRERLFRFHITHSKSPAEVMLSSLEQLQSMTVNQYQWD